MMRQVVLEELEHIPKGNNAQNELRLIYFNKRMHSLGKKAKEEKTAKDVLLESIALIKKEYPNFEPIYDEDFFKERNLKFNRVYQKNEREI
ncbi:MAG: hypothetical protein QXP77_03605 [Candidatus Aenigmatarchaeota archaeon]